MKVELTPGEMVHVVLADTDGEITVSYGGMKHGTDRLIVHADMPDVSGREGIIYCETFRTPGDHKDELATDCVVPKYEDEAYEIMPPDAQIMYRLFDIAEELRDQLMAFQRGESVNSKDVDDTLTSTAEYMERVEAHVKCK